MSRLIAAGIAVVALVAGQAAAAAPRASSSDNPQTFSDTTGDSGGALDIASVTVGNTAAGRVSFQIAFANAPAVPRAGDFVGIFIDADGNAATGIDGGFEYTLQTVGLVGDTALARWDGSAFQRVTPSGPLVKSWTPGRGLTLELGKADLGSPTDLTFWVASELLPDGGAFDGEFDDVAPDGDAVYEYAISTPQIRSAALRLSSAAPRAGRRFSVSVSSVTLATGEELQPDATRCRATIAGKALRGGGSGGCTFSIPRSAKRKSITLTVQVTVGTRSLTLTRSFRIR